MNMGKKMFDFVIGNPPYQEESAGNGRQNPIYHLFMNEAYKVSNCTELIHPARFLFNAGLTPKAWNEERLNDCHFKVLEYESDASKIFPTTEIKGGVAITIEDFGQEFKPLRIFTKYTQLNDLVEKVFSIHQGDCVDSVVSSRGCYRLTDVFFEDFPFVRSRLGKGTGNMIASNFFENNPEVYVQNPEVNDDYYGFLCRVKSKRTMCYLNKKYILKNDFLETYNIACSKSNGSGIFGEVLTSTEILKPNEGATDTFISIGQFKTETEVKNMQKYLKTKFLRALLGVKKVTQDNPKSVWSMIPLEDMTDSSDIDWSKSIHEIDLQLYKKYGLDDEEIAFIEEKVKEME